MENYQNFCFNHFWKIRLIFILLNIILCALIILNVCYLCCLLVDMVSRVKIESEYVKYLIFSLIMYIYWYPVLFINYFLNNIYLSNIIKQRVLWSSLYKTQWITIQSYRIIHNSYKHYENIKHRFLKRVTCMIRTCQCTEKIPSISTHEKW